MLFPPRVLGLAILGTLIGLSVALPPPLPDEASAFVTPSSVPADLFYAFWLPWVERMPEWAGWLGAIATFVVVVAVPRFARRERVGAFAPSVVDERICTGCNQCPQDCPWEAITMQPRTDGRETLVAHVNPVLCVSCGICAGSCAPMGVGPVLRTGRDQVSQIRAFMTGPAASEESPIVAIACENAAPAHLGALSREGAAVRSVPCTGNLHTSVIELALRGGARGVIVFSCPPRDCRGREGPKWLEQRVHHDREAELQSRVDRKRVRLATMAAGDLAGTLAAFRSFERDVDALARPSSVSMDTDEPLCEPVPVEADS
jgi:coenzyme F420-reducing hydrogenase delta subunit/Pyruvate/2-oxoacid:ferredoxin oxidoreductase delta subunit